MEQHVTDNKTEKKKLTLQLPKYHYLDLALDDFVKVQGKNDVFQLAKEDKEAKPLENTQDKEKETKDQKKKLLIVDVRTEDHVGGSIPNSIHIPYNEFESRVESLVTQTICIDHCATAEKEDELDKKEPSHSHHHHHHKAKVHIVFHCMYSRERGPACATSFLHKLEQTVSGYKHQQVIVPMVSVLMGGFTAFVNHSVNIEVASNGQEKKANGQKNKLSLKKEGIITDFDSSKWCSLYDEDDEQWKIFYKEDAEEVVALSPKPSRSAKHLEQTKK